MTWRVVFIAFALTGCSWQGSILGGPPIIAPPPGERVIATPNGTVIEEPAAPPIETVITGLSQAQAVRTYVRQLSH